MIFYPDKFKKKVLPKSFFDEELLTKKNLTLKQKAMQALILATDLDEKDLSKTILNVTKIYQNRIDDLSEEGIPKTKASIIAKDGEKLLRQRVESLVVFSQVQKIKGENEGQYYRWLPSGAINPDPQHQLLYGQTFLVGEGDDEGNMPGERYGCQCGMEILTVNEKDA
jgi:hypothetical protein